MQFLKIAIISILMSVFLSACSSTKLIEPVEVPDYGVSKTPEPDLETRETKVYSDDAVGSVEDIYGDQARSEMSSAYKEAIELVPELRYNIVYFSFNSADINEESKEVLRTHAEYLLEEPDVIVALEGHTDKRGSAGYNLALGERRSLAVRNFLTAYGIPQTQLAVFSFGEEKPIVSGTDEQAHSKNRRVEVIYR